MSRLLGKALLSLVIFAAMAGCTGGPRTGPQLNGARRRDGASKVDVPVRGSLQNPAWSPDGGALLFTRFRNGYNQGPADLLIVRLKSRSLRTLVSDGADNVNLPGSAWNPVTRRIAFSSSREPHDEVFTIGENGRAGDETRVTNRADRVAYEPSFSPDGRWVVFESHRLDVEEHGVITKRRVDGIGPYRALTGAREDSRQPNWSPDGALILYQGRDRGQWDIWTMSPDGTGKRRVTRGDGDETDASFSPDGRRIVYSADSADSGQGRSTGSANLFIVPAAGGDSIRLTDFDGYDGAPSWSPDGRRVAFESSPADPEDSGGTSIWIIEVPRAGK